MKKELRLTVKEIKRILSESEKYAVINRTVFTNKASLKWIDTTMCDQDELNILEFDNYFAIWR